MAEHYLETSEVKNDRDYSADNVKIQLERLREAGENPEKISEFEGYLREYPDEFAALYRIGRQGAGEDDEGHEVRFDFKKVDYIRPEIVPEEDDVKDQTEQLKLECTFEDGLSFGLSVHKAPNRNDGEEDEMPPLMGQVIFDEETIKNLNEEKINRIFDFCHRYGFSTFGLNIPMRDGEVDVDAKLAELLEKYKASEAEKTKSETPTQISEDENDLTGMREEDYNIIVPSSSLEIPEISAESSSIIPPTQKSKLTLDDVVKNMQHFVEKDLHKRKGLSYWEHVRTIDGRKTYVFSLYDKENPKNYENDGRKKDDVYVPTYSARLYVSQDSNGKFYFGYSTPGGKPLDQALAGDFVGEIKKTGVTHLNLSNIPNCDKKTWLTACGEKGIVPTGLSLNEKKAKQLIDAAKPNLTREELALYKERVADQMMENAMKKNPDKAPTYGLSETEITFIENLRNEGLGEQADLEYEPMKRQFKNFRDAFTDKSSEGLLNKLQHQSALGRADAEKGAATICGAAHTVKTVFDIYFNNFDKKLGERMAQILEEDAHKEDRYKRITPEEAAKLAPLSGKTLGEMDKHDFALMYDVLLPRHVKNSENDILEAYQRKTDTKDPRADAIILQQEIFPKAKEALQDINSTLEEYSIPVLRIPFENKVMRYRRPDHLIPKSAEKPAEKKPEIAKAMPERGSR